MEATYRELVSGCHILHLHQILDAYGHVSVRHPFKKDTFLMPRNMAPALVTSTADIVEYLIEDASPIESASPPGYVERFIHSEIYKMCPDVHSVVHSHSPTVLPYTITDIPFRACVHMSGFLGKNIPNFDIAEFYTASDVRDLLIRNQRLGEQLAKSFAFDDEGPKHPVVLMRGHGLTIVGNSIKQSVFRAIYTAENAKVQTIAMSLQAAASSRQAEPNVTTMRYLDDTELSATAEMTDWSSQRPWMLWIKEIELNGLYVNTC